METLLIRDRFKVVRVIAAQPGYALLEAVDIYDRETPSCLLNLYEGEHLRRYARICSAIRSRSAHGVAPILRRFLYCFSLPIRSCRGSQQP